MVRFARILQESCGRSVVLLLLLLLLVILILFWSIVRCTCIWLKAHLQATYDQLTFLFYTVYSSSFPLHIYRFRIMPCYPIRTKIIWSMYSIWAQRSPINAIKYYKCNGYLKCSKCLFVTCVQNVQQKWFSVAADWAMPFYDAMEYPRHRFLSLSLAHRFHCCPFARIHSNGSIYLSVSRGYCH